MAFNRRFCRRAFRRLVEVAVVPCGVDTRTDPSACLVRVTGI